jgi:hypothetical protein
MNDQIRCICEHASMPGERWRNEKKSETLLLPLWCASGFRNRCIAFHSIWIHFSRLTSATGSVVALRLTFLARHVLGRKGNGKKTILSDSTSLLRRSVDLYCLTRKHTHSPQGEKKKIVSVMSVTECWELSHDNEDKSKVTDQDIQSLFPYLSLSWT